MTTRYNKRDCCGGRASLSGDISSVSTGAGQQVTTAGGGCGCGTDIRGTDDVYVRPRFFAGQLLTEDDLSLLAAYVTQKNQLHNRYMYGKGVVCGLEVNTHPCGNGWIVVDPGFALDGCGNDIVVPCIVEIDINAMIRRLRIEALGGFDCGDPCDTDASSGVVSDSPTRPAPQTEMMDDDAMGAVEGENNYAEYGRDDARSGDETEQTETDSPIPTRRRYALYIRYSEELTDPVSPYSTDDACGGTQCQNTRIKEGYRFELRCADGASVEPDLFCSIASCVTSFSRMNQQLAGMRDAARIYEKVEDIQWGVDAGEPITITLNQQVLLSQDIAVLEKLMSRQVPTDAGWTKSVVEKVASISSLSSRIWFVDDTDGDRNALLTREGRAGEMLEQTLDRADDVLREVEDYFEDTGGIQGLQGLERLHAQETLHLSKMWVHPDAGAKSETRWLGEGPEGVTRDTEAELFVRNAVLTPALHNQIAELFMSTKSSLLQRLYNRERSADASLIRQLEQVYVERVQAVDKATALRLSKAGRKLEQLFLRSLHECLCDAFHPPCPTIPEERAVKLAEITMDNCQVSTVCSLSRTHVLTARALHYWLPPLKWLGRLLTYACCDVREFVDTPGSNTALGGLLVKNANGGVRFEPDALKDFLSQALYDLYGPNCIDAHRIDSYTETLTNIADIAGGHARYKKEAAEKPVKDKGELAEEVVESERFLNLVDHVVGQRFEKSIADGQIDLEASLAKATSRLEAQLKTAQKLEIDKRLHTFATSSGPDGLGRVVTPIVNSSVSSLLVEKGLTTAKIGAIVDKAVAEALADKASSTTDVPEMTLEAVDKHIDRRMTELLEKIDGITKLEEELSSLDHRYRSATGRITRLEKAIK